MLIERALRDRVTALQQGGSNDIALFGATGETFQSWGGNAAGAVAFGPATATAESEQSISRADNGAGLTATQIESAPTVAGGIDTPMASVTAQAGTTAFIGQSIAANSDASSGSETSGAVGGATTLTIQAATADGDATHVQSTTLTTGAATEQAGAIDVIPATAHLSEIETGLAQARADALERIEAIASTAAAQVEAIQTELAETITAAGAQVAALGNAASDTVVQIDAPVLDLATDLPETIGTTIIPPVLDLVADLPDTVGTTIAADVDAGLDAAVQLGDTQIELAQQIEISTDLALAAGLPIEGEDVAGGIATLVDLVTEESGFIVEDVTAGITWPLAAATPLDTLSDLAEPSGMPEPQLDPGDILLGIPDPGDLLGGLSDHDDFSLGLG